MISEAFGADGDPALNLNITVSLPPRNPYVPGDQPAYVDQSGPDCRGLTDIDAMIAAAQNGEFYCPTPPADGVDSADNPTTGNPTASGGRGPNDVPPGAGDPSGGSSPARPPGRLDSRTGLRAQHPRLPDRHGPGRGLRPGRLDDGAAAARDAGDAPMKGSCAASPGRWSSSSLFGLVTVLASYVLISTITNAGYGEQLTYRAQFTDVAGLVEGDEVRIAGVRVGQVTGIGLTDKQDRPTAEVELEVQRRRPAPRRRSRRRSSTATSSASATSR